VYDLKSGDLYGKTSYPDFADWSEQSHFFNGLAGRKKKHLTWPELSNQNK
jgi:hypothetical protein